MLSFSAISYTIPPILRVLELCFLQNYVGYGIQLRYKECMNLEYKKLGANVRKYRKVAGLTQEELAEIIGCSNSHIGQIENGRGIPSLDTMVKISNALGLMVDQFVIADSEHPELIYLHEIGVKLKSYPLKKRILACEMIENLLRVIDSSDQE